MRTKERWQEQIQDYMIEKYFPVRLQKDLKNIPMKKKNIPDPGSYFIHGPVRSGKTLIAAWIALMAMRKRYLDMTEEKILFVSVPDLLLEIRQSFEKNAARTESEIIAKYADADFLVLDDLGAEKMSDWVSATMYLIINRRYEWMKDTIITSNLNLEELVDKLEDDRIPARISRMCREIEKTDSYD